MRKAWACLRVSMWTVAVLAPGYAFAKIQGGFVGWYLFAVAAVLFAYEWAVVIAGARRWTVAVVPAREFLWTGEKLEVELRWRRPGWSAWLTWGQIAVESVGLHCMLSPGQRQGSRRVTLGAPNRGEYPLSPAVVEVSDFFGLYHLRREIPGGPAVVVYPRPLADGAMLRSWRSGPAMTRRGEERPGMAPRPYRPGDRLNWIHWRATAARGVLQSREAEAGDPSRWVVCLDLRRKAYGADPEAFETAIRAAATAVLERGDSRGGGMWTTQGWWGPGPHETGPLWPAVRRALAAARWSETPEGGAFGEAEAVHRAVREVRLRMGDAAVIITGEAGAREWEPILGRWRSRGVGAMLYVARGAPEGRSAAKGVHAPGTGGKGEPG